LEQGDEVGEVGDEIVEAARRDGMFVLRFVDGGRCRVFDGRNACAGAVKFADD
jgi:hypothetical protein